MKKKTEGEQTSLLPDMGLEESAQAQEGHMTVLVEFPSINPKDLKAKFDVDKSGHLYVELKFTAMIKNNVELARLGNLITQKGSNIFAMIGTNQAVMDFYYDTEDNKVQVLTSEDTPKPEDNAKETTPGPDGSGQGKETGKDTSKDTTGKPETGKDQQPGKSKRQSKKKGQETTPGPDGSGQGKETPPEPEASIDTDEMMEKAGYKQSGLLQIEKRVKSPFVGEEDTYIEPGKYIPYVSDQGVVRVKAIDGKWLVVTTHDYTWIEEPEKDDPNNDPENP